MQLCGHTMGTPALDIRASIDLFADLGLQGIEVRCAEDGHIHLETLTERAAGEIRRYAEQRRVNVACLTPYYKDFGSDEATRQTLEGFRIACRAATWLGCPLVRAMGGVWPVEGREKDDLWDRTVAGLQQAGDIAAQFGVKLAVENHIGTLSMSAQDTADLVEAVAHPHVGILLDYYWNVVAGDDCPGRAVQVQAPYLLHCHVKNMVWENGSHKTVLLEDGIIDWTEVIRALKAAGFDGYLSDEYEKFWKPEFPEPHVGMQRNAAYLRRCMDQAGASSHAN